MISLRVVCGRVARNLGRKVAATTTRPKRTTSLFGSVFKRDSHTTFTGASTTFLEWVHNVVDDHDCLHIWRHKLFPLGTTWDTFRRRDPHDVVQDLIQAGIPFWDAWDIVRLVCKEAERVATAPMTILGDLEDIPIPSKDNDHDILQEVLDGLEEATRVAAAPMAIFWDLENISIPSKCNGQDIVDRLKMILKPYGQLVLFRGYASIRLKGIPRKKQLDLHQSGCLLVDCPHGGRKDVVDKAILVDAMEFAYQNPDNATLCIIAGDIDYAYLLTKLQQNPNWRTIVIARRHQSLLQKYGDITFQWETDILQPMEENCDDTEQLVSRHDLVEIHENEHRTSGQPVVVDIPTKDNLTRLNLLRQELSQQMKPVASRNSNFGKELTQTKTTPTKAKTDVEMICHVMKVLQTENGSARPPKSVVGDRLRRTFPVRFTGSNTVKDFFSQVIGLGIVTEQEENSEKTLVLSKEYSADKTSTKDKGSSMSNSQKAKTDVEMICHVMKVLQAEDGSSRARKEVVGNRLRPTFPSRFTRSNTVKDFFSQVIGLGIVTEQEENSKKTLVLSKEYSADKTSTKDKGSSMSNSQKAKTDVEMICHVMKVLQTENGSARLRKDVVGNTLRRTFPSRFTGSNTVKDFFSQVIGLGIVTEQRKKNQTTLVLSKEYNADKVSTKNKGSSMSDSQKAKTDVEMICHVMKVLQAEDGSSRARKELVGNRLRLTFPSRFTRSNTVKDFFSQVIELGIVMEQWEKSKKTLVLSKEYSADTTFTKDNGSSASNSRKSTPTHKKANSSQSKKSESVSASTTGSTDDLRRKKIVILRKVIAVLKERHGMKTIRKERVGGLLREIFPFLFTKRTLVQAFLKDVIATGLVIEQGKGLDKTLVPAFPLQDPLE